MEMDSSLWQRTRHRNPNILSVYFGSKWLNWVKTLSCGSNWVSTPCLSKNVVYIIGGKSSIQLCILFKMLSPTINDGSPYFLLQACQPDYKSLRVFRLTCSLVFARTSTINLSFALKSVFFFCYNMYHKGYLCLSSSWRMFISRHMCFNEAEFCFFLVPYAYLIAPEMC